MPSLTDYQRHDISPLTKGIYTAILTADQLAPHLQFMSISGNARLKNRESTLPTATSYAVGSTWEDSEGTSTQSSVALRTIGVQSPVDRFAAQTLSTIQSQKGIAIQRMGKALSRKLAYLFVKGDNAVVATEPSGLDKMARSETRMVAADDGVMDGPGTAETELTVSRMDLLMNKIFDGQEDPDILIMNTTMRTKLTDLARQAGSGIVMNEIAMFGRRVRTYNGVPIVISNWITDAETYADSGTWPSSTATSIFAVKMGEKNEGVVVLHNGPYLKPDLQDIGVKENKNENLYRMVVYGSFDVDSKLSFAALAGIDSAA